MLAVLFHALMGVATAVAAKGGTHIFGVMKLKPMDALAEASACLLTLSIVHAVHSVAVWVHQLPTVSSSSSGCVGSAVCARVHCVILHCCDAIDLHAG